MTRQTGLTTTPFEGGRILANVSTLNLRYVAGDPGQWDAHLVSAVTRRVQVELVTRSRNPPACATRSNRSSTPARGHLGAQAKAVDGQENRRKPTATARLSRCEADPCPRRS